MNRRIVKLSTIGCAGVILSGCATYTPEPLDTDSLTHELVVPDEPAIQVLVSQLADPVLSSVVIDLSDGVSPDEAAVLSVVLNPSLRAQRASRGIATAEVLNAGLLPDPVLSISADLPSGGATGGANTGTGIGLDWAMSDLIDRQARIDAADRSKESIDLGILWAETLVSINAKGLVYGVEAGERSLSLLDDEIRLLEENVDRVKVALDAGQMTEVDMAAARASRDAAKTQRTTLNEQLERARIDLATLMGFPPDANVRVKVSLNDELDEPAGALSDLLKTMESDRLDLLALRRGYDSQEAKVRAAILRQFPRFSVGPNLARDTGNLTTVGIGIGIELPIFNANRGEIAIERATRALLAAEYTTRVHEARSGLAQELNRLVSAQSRLTTLHSSEQSQAKLVETYRIGLEQGHVDVLSYYQARRDLIEIRIVEVQTAAQIHNSRLLIEVLSGERWQSETGDGEVQEGAE